jgi:O-acetyl-ADP-ribose deacetylase (regulator of RNase III)
MSSTATHHSLPAESQQAHIPTINLLCQYETSSRAFRDAVNKYFPSLYEGTNVIVHNCKLANLPSTIQYDAIVSPANSYGFMDGAFDDAISIALSPNPIEGYDWTTKKVQSALYQKSRGYAPPGSCTIIDVRRDSAWHDIKRAEESRMWEDAEEKTTGETSEASNEHKGGCKYIALCPTMRVPRQVKWDREVIFGCIWSLLCALDAHNREEHDPQLKIKSILMTPLATGVGKVSEARWAAQCVLAMKYWLEAVHNPQKWMNLQWSDVYYDSSVLLDSTHNM